MHIWHTCHTHPHTSTHIHTITRTAEAEPLRVSGETQLACRTVRPDFAPLLLRSPIFAASLGRTLVRKCLRAGSPLVLTFAACPTTPFSARTHTVCVRCVRAGAGAGAGATAAAAATAMSYQRRLTVSLHPCFCRWWSCRRGRGQGQGQGQGQGRRNEHIGYSQIVRGPRHAHGGGVFTVPPVQLESLGRDMV